MVLHIALVLGVVAVGCKRDSDQPVTVPRESGSGQASIATPRKLQDAVCPPRDKGQDPGPTKAEQRPPQVGPPGDTADVKDRCVKHTDCTERDHGRCVHEDRREVYPFGQRREVPAHNECVYDECTSDDECRRTSTHEPRAELVCTCAPERNTCTFANCRKDSDCPSPFPCGAWRYCHSAADACRTDANCKSGEHCRYSWEVKHYVCLEPENIAPD